MFIILSNLHFLCRYILRFFADVSDQSDVEASVMLELCGMRSIPSLSLLPRLLWPGVVVPECVLSMVR